MNKPREQKQILLGQKGMVAYLQDGEFMGFTEVKGANVIKHSAMEHGFKVEDFGYMFNVVYSKGVSME